MKILMVTNTYFPISGGLEQSIRSFSNEFRKQGHEVLIAAPYTEGRAQDEEHVIRVPALQRFNKTEFSLNLPVPGFLSSLMKTFPPDIVHSHHPFFMGDYAIRLSRQYHVPLVFTYHIMLEKYTHYLPIDNEMAKRFVVEIASGYADLADQVIVPTVSVRDILIKQGVASSIEVVPTGIDLEHFSKGQRKIFREQNQIPLEAPVIGYAGRLAQEKNLDFLMNCLIDFLRKEAMAHILIVGQGPLEKMIRDRFEKFGFADRLHLTGLLCDQSLADAYSAMDIFAFSSLSETQGVVLIEAMASGVPVVAVDAPGVREVVKDQVNGRLINKCDKNEFIKSLVWSLNCPKEKWLSIKRQARKTAGEYSINSCAKRMLNIYEGLLSKEFVHSENNTRSWYMLEQRLKAEWDIFKNIIEAGETAVLEASFRRKQESQS